MTTSQKKTKKKLMISQVVLQLSHGHGALAACQLADLI